MDRNGLIAQTYTIANLQLFIILKVLVMKAMKLVHVVLATVVLVGTTVASANENGENVLYFGVGSAKSGDYLKSNKTPFSIGYLSISSSRDSVWGADISGEGTMLDSTWGQRSAVNQAMSYNFLIGRNLTKSESSRFDAALLLGMRQSFSSCPSSYLGYQCYADSAPDTKYAFNYGAVVTWTYKSLMLGVRATGESAQALLGFRF